MTQEDNKSTSEQISEDGLSKEIIQPQPAAEVEEKDSIANEFAHAAVDLKNKARTVGSEALELSKRHSHYTELGASLADGIALESLGEILGASLGTALGPEGTVIGAELGGMAGEVLGARQGSEIAQKLLHQPVSEAPLSEDLQKEGSAKITGHFGEQIGELIGDALFDGAGGEIAEVAGEKLGKLAGTLAYEHIKRRHCHDAEKRTSEINPKTETDDPKKD
jgi:uncharacterized protein YcfJ